MPAFNWLVDNDPLRLRDTARRLDVFARWVVAVTPNCPRRDDGYCEWHGELCPFDAIKPLLAEIDAIEGYE